MRLTKGFRMRKPVIKSWSLSKCQIEKLADLVVREVLYELNI